MLQSSPARLQEGKIVHSPLFPMRALSLGSRAESGSTKRLNKGSGLLTRMNERMNENSFRVNVFSFTANGDTRTIYINNKCR